MGEENRLVGEENRLVGLRIETRLCGSSLSASWVVPVLFQSYL